MRHTRIQARRKRATTIETAITLAVLFLVGLPSAVLFGLFIA